MASMSAALGETTISKLLMETSSNSLARASIILFPTVKRLTRNSLSTSSVLSTAMAILGSSIFWWKSRMYRSSSNQTWLWWRGRCKFLYYNNVRRNKWEEKSRIDSSHNCLCTVTETAAKYFHRQTNKQTINQTNKFSIKIALGRGLSINCCFYTGIRDYLNASQE